MGWSGQSNISSSPAGEIEVGHHNQLQGYFRTFYDKIYLHPFYTNKIQIHNGNCGSIPHRSVQYFCACSTHVWYGVAGVFHVRELLSQAVQCLDNSNGNCEVTVAPDLYQDPYRQPPVTFCWVLCQPFLQSVTSCLSLQCLQWVHPSLHSISISECRGVNIRHYN